MWAWLNNNYGGFVVVFQCLTLIVWTLYLQLFLSSVRHRTRPKVLINRGAGRSLDSRCIITNMSAEPVYVEAVVVALGLGKDRDGFTLTCSLGNIDRDQSQAGDPRSEWYQGPLQGAEYLDLGSFRTVIERTLSSPRGGKPDDGAKDNVVRLKITVLVSYTADSRTIAAERIFDIIDDGPAGEVRPRTLLTRQITSRWQRRRLDRLLFPD
ncbi:MAG TPA: hypothetical protein VFJ18_11180 [Pararhizobium sp.]|nr:hypothetical protein [Pararhizobium sp.]